MFSITNNKHLQTNNIKHYELGFIPKDTTIDNLRNCAFSPTVYREPTTAELRDIYTLAGNKRAKPRNTTPEYVEHRMNHRKHGGYRAYKFVIGLLDSGYVDIDGIDAKTAHTTNAAREIPTLENVHATMVKHKLQHYVFQSASAKVGKLRLIYKRNFMLYYTGVYDAGSNQWSLIPPVDKIIHTTNPDAIDVSAFSQSMTGIIRQVIYQETEYLSGLLSAEGINTTGIDATAARAHMHSAHCIKPNTVYKTPLYGMGGTL